MGENHQVIERRIAVVFLVDPQGRLLMQHRSPDAAVSPNQWTMPGGKIEDGEDPADAARREVHEETGLTVDALIPVWRGTRPSVKGTAGVVEIHAYGTVTAARQEDVVVGEGQAMVFLPPQEARELDLGVTARLILVPFLESPQYQQLRETAARQRPAAPPFPCGSSAPRGTGTV